MRIFSHFEQLKKEKYEAKREVKSLDAITDQVAAKIATYTDQQLYDAAFYIDTGSSHVRFIARCAKEELERRIRATLE